MKRIMPAIIATFLCGGISATATNGDPMLFWQIGNGGKPAVSAPLDIRTDKVRNPAKAAIKEANVQAAQRHGVPVEFMNRLTMRESGFRFVRGPATPYGYAYGPHQILCATAAELGERDCGLLMRDAQRSADLSARYVRQGYEATGSWAGAAAYYHGGPNTRLWGKKTAAYANAVGGAVPPKYVVATAEQKAQPPIPRDLTFGAGIVPSIAFSALSHARW